MILIICGGVGSCKSLMAVKLARMRARPCFTNFPMRDIGHVRLTWDMLLDGDKVNWGFWRKMQAYRFDIYIDELHNLMPSRRAMSKRNVTINNWLSQMRKILGSSKDYHFVIITQRPNSIDVHFRELAHQWWYMRAVELEHAVPTVVWEDGGYVERQLPVTLAYRTVYASQQKLEYDVDGVRYRPFVANEYYRYYDSYAIVEGVDESGYV